MEWRERWKKSKISLEDGMRMEEGGGLRMKRMNGGQQQKMTKKVRESWGARMQRDELTELEAMNATCLGRKRKAQERGPSGKGAMMARRKKR